MSIGTTGRDKFERIMYILAAASREGGISLEKLAQNLGVSEAKILDDISNIEAATSEAAENIQIDVNTRSEGTTVRVPLPGLAGGIHRPVQLTHYEALCLALAIRGTTPRQPAGADEKEHQARDAFLARVERHLVQSASTGEALSVSVFGQMPDPLGIRDTVVRAAHSKQACLIEYLKAGAESLSERVIHPYAIVHAEGKWYAVSYCTQAEGTRLFRLDRMLSAKTIDESFKIPNDFDVSSVVKNGVVYQGTLDGEDERVTVRYDSRIARWMKEHHLGKTIEERENGDLIVQHRVADRRWIVTHVLRYGAYAEILEPTEIRTMVQEAVRRVLNDPAGATAVQAEGDQS